MKIISYNVNGIRAALKKGFIDWLQAANPDVICIQETKAHKEQLDLTLFETAGKTTLNVELSILKTNSKSRNIKHVKTKITKNVFLAK